MKANQLSRRRKASRWILITAVVFVVLGCSHDTEAQWTTPNTSGNINNTNSGNVGVGTTTPEFPLQVNSASSNVFGMLYTGTLSLASGAGIQSLTFATPSAADQRLGFYTFGVRSGGTSYNPVAMQGFSSQPWTLNSAQGGYLTFSTTQNGSTTRTERLRINHDGKVGIGTTAPTSPLTVVAPGGVRQGFQLTGSGDSWIYTDLRLTPVGTIATGKPNDFAWSLRKDAFYGNDASGPSMVMEIWRQGGGTYVPFIINPNGDVILAGANNATNGYVGIGTTNPLFKLDVKGGNINAPGLCIAGVCKTDWSQVSGSGGSSWTTTPNTTTSIYYSGSNIGIGTSTPPSTPGYSSLSLNNSTGSLIDFKANDVLKARLQSDGTNFHFNNLANGPIQFYTNNNTERMRIAADGNVGIGTTTPTAKLDVGGLINTSQGLCIAGVCKTDWSQVGGSGSSPWLTSPSPSTNIFYNTGNVGLGTSNPSTRLHISAGDSSFALFGPNTTWGGTLAVGSGAAFVSPIAGRAQVLSSNGNLHLDAGTSQNVYVGWLTPSNTIINGQGGNVGIGTQSPAAKLDVKGNVSVTGDITATGNIAAKYQDVAEWVPSAQELSAGTVVVLDASRTNHVLASTKPYDTGVAGVVSEEPGIILGEQGDNKLRVATTGRVKIKVDASNGPIEIGDLLVTSDKEGFAMKSMAVDVGGVRIHRPGTLIGKALEPLVKGSGEILVLLSLQ
jgi:hypothetical protein